MSQRTYPISVGSSRLMAIFAASSYEPLGQTRWNFFKKNTNLVKPEEWNIEHRFSTARMAVWVNHVTREVVTANRGTASFSDVVTDVRLATLGEELTGTFLTAYYQYGLILRAYPKYSHFLTGHSLGGTINKYLKIRYGPQIRLVFNFNPGAGFAALVKSLGHSITGYRDPTVHDFFIRGDPLSFAAMSDPGTTQHIRDAKHGSNPHSIQQFY